MSSLSGSEMTGNKDRTWLLTYFPAAWLGHACQVGHVILITSFWIFHHCAPGSSDGYPRPHPALPGPHGLSPHRQVCFFLSENRRKLLSIARINFIWTLRALGSCLSTLVTGAVFKSLVTRPGEKLTFLATCVLLTGLFMGLVPWASSFYVLLISKMS